MKKNTILFMAALLLCLFMASMSWGTTWYVNPVTGDDDEQNPSYNDPLRTISEAIDRAASSSDIIRLFTGDYAREGFKYVSLHQRHVLIDVNKSLTIERVSSSFDPKIVGYYNTTAGSDSLVNGYIMLLRASNISIKYITFDGYNYYYEPGGGGWFDPPDSTNIYMPHHGTIGITGDATNAKVEGCEFWHMGRSIDPRQISLDKYKHEGIIGAHPSGRGDTVSNVQIIDNTFYQNEMDTSHGHEIYLTACQNSEISGNTIYNHGVGVPIRFSWECSNVLVEDNIVYGAAENGYIHDWTGASMDGVSTGIKVIDNTFGTSALYESNMHENYTWPFRSSGENGVYSGFISEFTGNTVNSNYSDDNYVQAVTISDDSLYIAQNDDEAGFLSSRIHRFPNPSGPIFRPCVGESIDLTLCRGDMCVVDNYIITASVTSAGANWLGYFLPDNQNNAASVYPAVGASDKVTALCASDFTEMFITGITESGTAKLYLGTKNGWNANLLWQSASVDSITAITRNGTTLVFAGYDDSAQTTTFYYGTLGTYPYSLSIQGSSSSSYTYVPAMAYKGNTLITATSTTYLTPEESRLYEGTASTPLNSCVYGPSTTTQFYSLAANSDYLFTVVCNDNHKLFISDTTSDPFDEVLFYSYWGTYDINEE